MNTQKIFLKIFLLLLILIYIYKNDSIYATQNNINELPELYSIDFGSLTDGWIVGNMGTIICTKNGGISWDKQNCPTNSNLGSVEFVDKDNGWIIGEKGLILKTTNGGNDWYILPNEIMDITAIHFLDKNIGWILALSGNILYTTDGGNSWKKQNTGSSYLHMDISFVNQTNGWIVGRGTSPAFNVQVILKTTDSGNSWQSIGSGTGALYQVHFTSKDTGYACGYGPRVTLTKNGGKSWQKVELPTNLLVTQLHSIYFINNLNGWVVGDADMIYHTTNSGLSWIQPKIDARSFEGVYFINSQIGVVVYRAGSSPNIYGAIKRTEDGGATWTTPLITNVKDKDISKKNYNYVIMQNYPNPFNSETVIQYSIPEASHVMVEIYNVHGNQIAIIKDAVENAGNYSVKWNGKNSMNQEVSGGIYLCKIQAGKYQKTIRMVLLK